MVKLLKLRSTECSRHRPTADPLVHVVEETPSRSVCVCVFTFTHIHFIQLRQLPDTPGPGLGTDDTFTRCDYCQENKSQLLRIWREREESAQTLQTLNTQGFLNKIIPQDSRPVTPPPAPTFAGLSLSLVLTMCVCVFVLTIIFNRLIVTMRVTMIVS